MATKRKGLEPNSMASNPKSSRLIATLVSTRKVKIDDKSSKCYRRKTIVRNLPRRKIEVLHWHKKLVAKNLVKLRPRTTAADSEEDEGKFLQISQQKMTMILSIVSGGSERPECGASIPAFKPLAVCDDAERYTAAGRCTRASPCMFLVELDFQQLVLAWEGTALSVIFLTLISPDGHMWSLKI
eukprot:IDg5086t1